MGNSGLSSAKTAKKDEFYTSLEDIEKEMVHYRNHFEGKTILLNCDDPDWSNFWVYFSLNFDFLGLKGLISTHYVYDTKEEGPAYMLRYDSQKGTNEEKVTRKNLKGDGDFRSEECIELLKEADIVITNPPFSLFREYVSQLIEYDKKFILIGNTNAITYKEVFPLLKDNKMWIGCTNFNVGMYFYVPDDFTTFHKISRGRKMVRVSTSCWYTNLEHNKRNEDVVLTHFFEGNEDNYPKYDNYDAIEVSTYKDIPMDYDGVMGVPITFVNHHNPEQFEILGITKTWFGMASKTYPKQIQVNKNGSEKEVTKLNDGPVMKIDVPLVNETYYKVENNLYRQLYARILVRNKKVISKKEMLGF